MKQLITIILGFICFQVYAESLYLQQIKGTSPNAEMLEKSLELINEHKYIKVLADLEVPPFHKRKTRDDSLIHSFCTSCHLSPPHSKNLRARTFLNMHTQYIACETCHFQPDNTELNYQWVDFSQQKTIEAKATLFRQPIIDEKGNPLPHETNNFQKIAPFYQGEMVSIFQSHSFSNETKKFWKTASNQQKAHYRAKIHAPLNTEGRECQACHQKQEPLLNLSELGATLLQKRKIQTHIVPQFFKRYDSDDQKIKINRLLK